ncbi:hypothetical protein CCP3SC1AL1_110015 [Gammaproteobacteria bacterium]
MVRSTPLFLDLYLSLYVYDQATPRANLEPGTLFIFYLGRGNAEISTLQAPAVKQFPVVRDFKIEYALDYLCPAYYERASVMIFFHGRASLESMSGRSINILRAFDIASLNPSQSMVEE